MYAHLVTPQKIRLSRRVQLVPQIGHSAAIVHLCFELESGVLAALDDSGSVHVWGIDPREVLLITPLPSGNWDRVAWLPGHRLAAREISEEDGQTAFTWWIRRADAKDRWRAGGSTLAEIEPALAGRPKLDPIAMTLTVGEPAIALEGGDKLGDGPRSGGIDPLGRFCAVSGGTATVIVDSDNGNLIRLLDDDHGARILETAITPSGDRMVTLDETGVVHVVDPMRGLGSRDLGRVREATSLAIDGTGKHAAIGDGGGQITVLDMADGGRLLKTAKRVRGFDFESPLAEQVGYVGGRAESFGAFLEDTTQILPMRPLPEPATALVSGRAYPLLVAALESGKIIEIDLSDDTVNEVARAPFALNQIAVGRYGVIGTGSGGLWWFDGESHTTFPVDNPEQVIAIATDLKTSAAALVYPNRIEIVDDKGRSQGVVEGVDAISVAFLMYKGRRTLVAVDRGGVLWRWAIARKKLTRAGVVELPKHGALRQVRSLTVDEDDTLRGAAYADNDHRSMVIIDPKSGEANLVLGVVAYGHQVVAVYDDDGVYLRRDGQHNVRMVSELKAFEPHDWMRRPEPGLA